MNKKSEIERIKLQLEKKLLDIEKRKKVNRSKKNKIVAIKEEKSLFELRKELQELQKNKKIRAVKIEKKSSSITSPVQDKAFDNKEIKKNIPETKKVEKSPTIISKTENVVKEIKIIKNVERDNISKTTTETVEKKPISIPKEPIKKTSSKQKNKKSTIARNKIIFIIAFVFAALYLGYLYKLKLALKKEKEALESKKQEQIDYSKGDAVFKEVEEETPEEDLQDIK